MQQAPVSTRQPYVITARFDLIWDPSRKRWMVQALRPGAGYDRPVALAIAEATVELDDAALAMVGQVVAGALEAMLF